MLISISLHSTVCFGLFHPLGKTWNSTQLTRNTNVSETLNRSTPVYISGSYTVKQNRGVLTVRTICGFPAKCQQHRKSEYFFPVGNDKIKLFRF
jgi:hypothetical protein